MGLTDHARGRYYYLAFDLMLAEAPIVDGRADLAKGRVARSDDPAEASRFAVIRAALLGGGRGELAAEAEAELARARELAAEAGLDEPPALPGTPDG